MRSRYLSGLYPLEDFAPRMRAPAGHVGMDRADRWIALAAEDRSAAMADVPDGGEHDRAQPDRGDRARAGWR